MLTLTVDVDAGCNFPALVDRVALLAPHVDVVRVNTLGVGMALSDLLATRGVEHDRFNPVERAHA